jgi:hypothetical protein
LSLWQIVPPLEERLNEPIIVTKVRRTIETAPIVEGGATVKVKTVSPNDAWDTVDKEKEYTINPFAIGSNFTNSMPTAQFVVEGTVEMKAKNDISGIIFSRYDKTSPLKIKNFASRSLFSKTALKPGMTVLDINNQEMTWKSPSDAVAAIQNARPGTVTIRAILPSSMTQTSKQKEDKITMEHRSFSEHLKWLVNNVSEEGGIYNLDYKDDIAFDDPSFDFIESNLTDSVDDTSKSEEAENKSPKESSLSGPLLGSKFLEDNEGDIDSEEVIRTSMQEEDLVMIGEEEMDCSIFYNDNFDMSSVRVGLKGSILTRQQDTYRIFDAADDDYDHDDDDESSVCVEPIVSDPINTSQGMGEYEARKGNDDILFSDDDNSILLEYGHNSPRSPHSCDTFSDASFLSFDYDHDGICSTWEYQSLVIAPLVRISQVTTLATNYMNWLCS